MKQKTKKEQRTAQNKTPSATRVKRNKKETTVSDKHISTKIGGKMRRLPVEELTPEFVQWNLGQRIANLKNMRSMLEGGTHSHHGGDGFGSHLPLYITYNPTSRSLFPANAATKGTGFVAKDEYLQYYIDRFTEVYERTNTTKKLSPKEMLARSLERVDTIMEFYEHPEKIDLRCMTGLEIWPGRTSQNFMRDPRVSVHFLGMSTKENPNRYNQWQVNCIWEKLDPSDIQYQFGVALRALTLGSTGRSFVPGHIPVEHTPMRGNYRFGWRLWVVETLDKGIDRLPHNES